jgi:hypothetical protein
MPRRGRPRQNDEEREIRQRIANNRRKVVSLIADFIRRKRPLTARDHALVAARVLRTRTERNQRCSPLVQELLKFAKKHGPHGRWDNPSDFLEEFIVTHGQGRQNSWTYIVPRTRDACDERNINEMAEMRRHSRALRQRFATPAKPDPSMLRHLRAVKPYDATTWPTLRELKIATALSERRIKMILVQLRPKPANGEIIKLPLRHVFTTRGSGSKRGGLPKRYHPRLVLGVINVLICDLADYPIGDEERKCFREVAMTVKRALTQKLGASGSST